MPWSLTVANLLVLVLRPPLPIVTHTCFLYIQGSSRTGDNAMATIDRMAVAMASAEALPQDVLRQAHPRDRTLEDLRLERPELMVGCWASG